MEHPCLMWQCQCVAPPVADRGRRESKPILRRIRRWADRCPVGPSFNEKPRWTSVFTATKHEPQDAKRKAEKGDASRLGYCRGGYWRIQVNTPIAGNVADASVVVRSAATDRGPRSSECSRQESRSRNDSR